MHNEELHNWSSSLGIAWIMKEYEMNAEYSTNGMDEKCIWKLILCCQQFSERHVCHFCYPLCLTNEALRHDDVGVVDV